MISREHFVARRITTQEVDVMGGQTVSCELGIHPQEKDQGGVLRLVLDQTVYHEDGRIEPDYFGRVMVLDAAQVDLLMFHLQQIRGAH
jgi:hypothetical protein